MSSSCSRSPSPCSTKMPPRHYFSDKTTPRKTRRESSPSYTPEKRRKTSKKVHSSRRSYDDKRSVTPQKHSRGKWRKDEPRREDRHRSRGLRSDRWEYGRERSPRRESRSGRHNAWRNAETPKKRYRFDSPPEGFKPPSKISNFSDAPAGFLPNAMLKSNRGDILKPARELYVGNLPGGMTVDGLLDYLNSALISMKATTAPGNPAVKGWISGDGHYSFVEFRSVEETTSALTLSGTNLLGCNLRIGRPKTCPPELLSATACISIALNKGTERLCVSNLPKCLEEEKVKRLLETFGRTRHFRLLRQKGKSMGICVLEYNDVKNQKAAEDSLHGFVMSSHTLKVQKAEKAVDEGWLLRALRECDNDNKTATSLTSAPLPSCVLMLSNFADPQTLGNESEYLEIVEDVRQECGAFGEVVSLCLPKPGYGGNSVGFAFVQFKTALEATAAKKALDGRKFDGRIVKVHYFSEDRYAERDFSNPGPNIVQFEQRSGAHPGGGDTPSTSGSVHSNV